MKKIKSLRELLKEQKRETLKKSIENNKKNGQKSFTKDQKIGICYAQYHKNGISYIINLNDLEVSLIAYEDFFTKRNNLQSEIKTNFHYLISIHNHHIIKSSHHLITLNSCISAKATIVVLFYFNVGLNPSPFTGTDEFDKLDR